MRYEVEISKDAKEDLYTIYRYITHELLVKETAEKQIESLEKGILSLDTMPERHRIYNSSKWQQLRMMPIDNYCVFYTANSDTRKVNVVRILYGRRNFDTVLSE